MTDLNWVDYVVLGVLFASIAAGLMRGLIKEILSLITWVAAFIVSSMFTTQVAKSFSHPAAADHATTAEAAAQSTSLIMLGISFVGLFLAVLLVGALVSYFITRAVEGQGISFANRFLGGLFGLARGVLLLLFVSFLLELTPLENQPWWKQSQFVAAFQPTIEWLDKMVQPGLEKLKAELGDTIKVAVTQFSEQKATTLGNL